jgi:KUP system potassium uptake protein
VITPAISVLSAMEGLKVVTPAFNPYIVPIALVILIALFAVQSQGTARVAAFFGPVMVVWFLVLIGTGLLHISDDFGVFAAINPVYGAMIFVDHPGVALAVPRGGGARRHGNGIALFRPWPFWSRAGARRLARARLPGAHHQLFRAGRTCAEPSRNDREPFFNLVPEWAALPLVVWRRSPPSRRARRSSPAPFR